MKPEVMLKSVPMFMIIVAVAHPAPVKVYNLPSLVDMAIIYAKIVAPSSVIHTKGLQLTENGEEVMVVTVEKSVPLKIFMPSSSNVETTMTLAFLAIAMHLLGAVMT